MEDQTGIKFKLTKKGLLVTRLESRVIVYSAPDSGSRGVLSDITYPSVSKAKRAMNEIE